jgi:hypothetical protein
MELEFKPPEEGMLWEWRAFGKIEGSLAAEVSSYPIRLGILNQPEEDTYLVSPNSDQNVKLRNYASGSALKLKLLFATGPDSIELYNESTTYIHRFPISRAELEEAARLLGVQPRNADESPAVFTPDQFIRVMAESSPAVFTVNVRKTRTQYAFEGGWFEVADVFFPQGKVQTISIQSPDLQVVQDMLKRLSPGEQLEVMNYVEACRHWA